MAAEIERKFLILDDRWRQHACGGSVLRQAYLVSTKAQIVRVRTIDARRATLTVKIRTSRTRREEFEYDIPYADACEMFQHARGIVEKTRYEVNHQGFVWEVDVYSGQNRGLIVAEIELDSCSDNPPLPEWLGPEVTGNPHFSNRALAKMRHIPAITTARFGLSLPLPASNTNPPISAPTEALAGISRSGRREDEEVRGDCRNSAPKCLELHKQALTRLNLQEQLSLWSVGSCASFRQQLQEGTLPDFRAPLVQIKHDSGAITPPLEPAKGELRRRGQHRSARARRCSS